MTFIPIDTPVWTPRKSGAMRLRAFRGASVATVSQVESGYRPGAWIPNFGEVAELPPGSTTLEVPKNSVQWVAAFGIPDDVVRFGRNLVGSGRGTDVEAIQEFGLLLIQCLRPHVKCLEGVAYRGFRVAKGGALTTSQDHRAGAFVGLHVDSWDGGWAHERGLSRNRCCLNLGCADRSFLFLPFSVMSLSTKPAGRGPSHSASAISRSLLASNPQVPIIEIILRPGEAYIAPTETIVHDGSSRLSTSVDVTYTLRGRIVAEDL